jgi:ABC-2 type transport system permease protein
VPLAVLAGLLLDLTPPTALGLLLGLVSAALATAIAISANLIVGMAGFVTTNTWGVRYLYSTVQAALSGQLVALELMPAVLRSTVEALPFAAMVSTPTRLLLGRYDRASGAAVLLLGQAGWLIALTALAVAAWRGASRADSAAVGG